MKQGDVYWHTLRIMKSKQARANQTKDIKESLRKAAEIRRTLEGRRHTDSTELLAADRSGVVESLAEREYTLEELLSRVTKENQHAEIDFGAPVSEEKW